MYERLRNLGNYYGRLGCRFRCSGSLCCGFRGVVVVATVSSVVVVVAAVVTVVVLSVVGVSFSPQPATAHASIITASISATIFFISISS